MSPNLPKGELCVTEMGQETVRLCIKELIQSSHPSLNLHRVLGPFLHFEAISVSFKRFMSYYPKHYAAEGAIYIESKY